MEINIISRRPRPTAMPEIPTAHAAHQLGWLGMGMTCVQEKAAKFQGGLGADFGAYDVTDTKFSTRMGPPSCSPPA